MGISWFPTENYVYYLGQTPYKSASWFLVQTNYDRWQPDPADDNRRTYGEEAMLRLGQSYGATQVGLWMALSEWPVHNTDTFYSVIMSVSAPTRGFIRQSMFPKGGIPPP